MKTLLLRCSIRYLWQFARMTGDAAAVTFVSYSCGCRREAMGMPAR